MTPGHPPRTVDNAAPAVAVTATTKVIDGMRRVRLNDAYVQAVQGAGLVPLVVPPIDPAGAEGVLDAVKGVILTGGEDVDPSEYGMPPGPHTGVPHVDRDRFEIALLRLAHERRVPTLAICRGVQLANVAFGGTLVQDIASECPGALQHDRSRERTSRIHDVALEPDSRLARAVGAPQISVNSSHHQALGMPAEHLRVTARATDRIVEGVEWVGDDWWMLGVQWHPEELVAGGEPWDRRLFAAFAAVVRERS